MELDLSELTVRETDGFTVTVKTLEPLATPHAPVAQPPQVSHRPAVHSPSRLGPLKEEVPLISPMTGIFYRSMSPGEPFLVNEGDLVVEGQTIGLIEAMKVFSEVPAEAAGTVTRFAAEDGKLLGQGHPILFLDPA